MSLSRKKIMIDYLRKHFRYNTENSWNNSTSYAANVKINRLDIPSELRDTAYDLIDSGLIYPPIRCRMEIFEMDEDYKYQVGFNGRSGGYIVMYRGGKKKSEYKRICLDCGQRNYKSTTTKCGKCGSEEMEDWEGYDIFSNPGKDIDQGETFEEWSTEEVLERYRLVRRFDKMVEDCRKILIDYCKKYKVVEKQVPTTKTIKVLEKV